MKPFLTLRNVKTGNGKLQSPHPKRWSRSLKLGAGYTFYPSACLREKKASDAIRIME